MTQTETMVKTQTIKTYNIIYQLTFFKSMYIYIYRDQIKKQISKLRVIRNIP